MLREGDTQEPQKAGTLVVSAEAGQVRPSGVPQCHSYVQGFQKDPSFMPHSDRNLSLAPGFFQLNLGMEGNGVQERLRVLEENLAGVPLFQRLRDSMPWWQKHASSEILSLITAGVTPEWDSPPVLSIAPYRKSVEETSKAREILLDYQKSGAVKVVDPQTSKFLVPWFVISKVEGDQVKDRLICDCRKINQFLSPRPFRLDHLQNIFPYLRKGQWAAKIDLKDAYFHLPLGEELRPYVHLQVGSEIWEFQAACFGLSTLPQKFMSLMRTFEKIWRKRGIMCYIYLDDILVVGSTPQQVQKDLNFMVDTLVQSGMKINLKKSILSPTQEVQHLGFTLNFKEGALQVAPGKLKTVKKELGKLITKKEISCRKMAAILGVVRSFLVALPFLRAFTDLMVHFVNQHQNFGWDFKNQIPEELRAQIREVKTILETWVGRPFQTQEKPQRELHSDSSTHAWAGLDLKSGKFVQEFWRGKASLHINVKELEAAIATVKSLARPRKKFLLSVDNLVAYTYLTKGGGRKRHFNQIMRPFLKWCLENQIFLSVQWVPSQEMKADTLSRWSYDRGDYTLDRNFFRGFCKNLPLGCPPK